MTNLSDLSVAILAGGLGTRLRSVLEDRPKVLAPVAGRPFLGHLLDRLSQYAIREVVLLVGYRALLVRETMGETHRGMRLAYSVENSPLGTAGALRHALPLLRSPTVLLLNGDSFSEADLGAFRQTHRRQKAAVSLVLTHVPDTSRFGSVAVDEWGRVLQFIEKGATAGPGWINAGTYLLERELIAELAPGRPVSLERDLMPDWVEAGKVHGYRDEGHFLDIGTPQSYAAAEEFYARHLHHLQPQQEGIPARSGVVASGAKLA